MCKPRNAITQIDAFSGCVLRCRPSLSNLADPSMTSNTHEITLEIASRFEMLEGVRGLFNGLAALVGFGEDATHELNVAVRESLVNAIQHGNECDAAKRVQIAIWVEPGSIRIQVLDEGKGFDPALIPDPLVEENLLKTDGRGIFFMRSFMNEVSWEFPVAGGTLVTMTKRKS